jgi:Protein of unknown function (DUF4239)
VIDWLYRLPILWMAVVVFGATYLVAAIVDRIVLRLASGERATAFKAVSPGMLPPLGIIFGLLVAFIAAQVWGDLDRATTAVNREASALRAVVLLAPRFPEETQNRLRALVARHVHEAVTEEWPAMAQRRASLVMTPAPLAAALQLTLNLDAKSPAEATAQREIVTAIETALDARRQRIITSRATVNWVKWLTLIVQAICTMVAIAMVHSDNRKATGIALGLFSTGVAVSILLIAAHNRPFTGELSVQPDILQQVLPAQGTSP